MTFWLPENAGHRKTLTAPFRFTIGRQDCFGSVEKFTNRLRYWNIDGKKYVKLKQSEFFQKGTLSGTSAKGL
jgi:hypothetical protein